MTPNLSYYKNFLVINLFHKFNQSILFLLDALLAIRLNFKYLIYSLKSYILQYILFFILHFKRTFIKFKILSTLFLFFIKLK